MIYIEDTDETLFLKYKFCDLIKKCQGNTSDNVTLFISNYL